MTGDGSAAEDGPATGNGPETGNGPVPGPRSPSAQRSLGAIVLGFEAVVVFLGALVMFGLKVLPAPVALIGGISLCVAMVVTAGLLRYRFAFVVGWILQAIVLASGVLVGMMFIVGAIFTGLWAYCMVTGSRLDRRNRAITDLTSEQ